ncbi:VPA1262 family N-terminal domain-containing protein [Paraburkholderia humisilvae]|uniref:Phospholipase D-like domain-containing protein n=1 Tax=Paraburkholderia humisilvae TaxID=627669 RepID=A0A6J5DPI4_9BURK|nr:VPA1262 family N-terminal domain-containing protein [Paraburkholderia humisilvae]CAB3755437.1 hypothetical protein LMG29542_02594 [Paraburkholderia humisilvae]
MSESKNIGAAVQWEHGIIHLVWWRFGKVRRLVFGWIELMPIGAPLPPNHPFLRKRISGANESFVHVARFPMNANAAVEWFDSAQRGALVLPTHPLLPTPGDGAELLCGDMDAEPKGSDWAVADQLPFLPQIHGLAEVRGLHGKMNFDVEADTNTDDFDQWFKDHMFFSLREHSEFRGSLLCVRYDPVVRWVDNRLMDLSAIDEAELYRVSTWPSASSEGLKISVTQRRPYGTTKPIVREIARPGTPIEIQWRGKIAETASEIVDRDGVVRWRSGFTSFLRQIGIQGAFAVGTDAIEVREDGKVIDSFSKSKLIGPRGAGNLVGEALRADSFQVAASVSRFKREERERLAQYAPTWLEDEKHAANLVRAILGQARQSVWIFDPYFSARGLLRFVLSVQPGSPKVEVFTSAKHLRTKLKSDPSKRVMDGVQSAMADLKAHKIDIELRLLPGGAHPIHDRFIVVDESRAWMSGNSLSAIGRRASVLLEVPLCEDLIGRLTDVRKKSTSFNDWLSRGEGEIEDVDAADDDGAPL